MGPFQVARGRFHRGQVIPLFAGDFGEINKNFEEILKVLAREAASGTVGLSISPLVNNDRKGGAYPIMLQQVKRAIGVAIASNNARHKLGRLHYVRSTADESAHTCRRSHSTHRCWANHNGRATWFDMLHSENSKTDMTSVSIRCNIALLEEHAVQNDNRPSY